MMKKRPWILVVLAFLLLIGAWTALITIAVNHAPEKVEVTPEPGAPSPEP
jgi:hypothetical protein